MTPDEYKKTTDTFMQLCELPLEARQTALDELGRQDPKLREAVETMLRHDDDGKGRLQSMTQETLAIDRVVGQVVLSSIARVDPGSENRYERTRLHATGGMGQVWLARDNSIGRNVALKELRPEGVGTLGINSRFLNEAKVTGQLEHPGIVPVYEVATDASGKPFYTMRFVKGRTLHEEVQEFIKRRTESGYSPMELRELITTLIGVANAIGYAHSRGVIHRDLKGQNVVLGDYGEVIVLDWGLASFVGATDFDDDRLPVSGSGVSNQTHAGQVVGTPAYMSPEQASGISDKMTVQTDVFGLGAMLYEMLTGKAPYGGDLVVETLVKAKAGSCETPRSVWSECPRALEAICLKAMAKEQADRYASAIDFADDLRRWLADESVHAYPDPVSVRISRWARRHKNSVLTAAALAVTALIALAISTILISREQVKTAAAYKRAEANLSKAREAVQRMLTEVGDERLKNVPQMEKLRETLLKEALEFNKGFLQDSDDPDIRKEAGLAHGKLATIYLMLGNTDEAVNSGRQGVEILKDLHQSAPNNQDYTRMLAESLFNSAITQQKLGLSGETESTCRKAIELLEPLVKSKSANDEVLATIADCQGTIGQAKEALSQNADAESWFKQAIQSYEQLSEQGRMNPRFLKNNSMVRKALGQLFTTTGRTKEAKDQFNEMLRLTSAIVTQQPEDHHSRSNSSQANQSLSDIERSTGDRESSRKYALEALRIREELVRDFPHIADYQYSVAHGYGSIAIAFAESGNTQEAEKYFVRGADASRKLATSFPSIPNYRYQAAISTRVLGVFFVNTQKLDEAKVNLIDAVSRFDALIADFPDSPAYRMDLAVALGPLARCCQFQKSLTEAKTFLERSILIYEQLLSEKTDIMRVRHKLAQDYRLMGELLVTGKDMPRAEEFLRKAIAMHRQMVAEFPEVAEHHRYLAAALDKLADFLLTTHTPDGKQLDEAFVAIDEAIQIRQRLSMEKPTWYQPQAELAQSLSFKGRILEAKHDLAGAAAMFDAASVYCADLLKRYPGETNSFAEYASSHEQRARLYKLEGHLKEAFEELSQATVIRRDHVAKFPNETRARNELRVNLADTAEVQLLVGDHDAALALLKESLALPSDKSWEKSLRAAQLLAQCSQRPDGFDSTIGDLAVTQLQQSIEAGLPNIEEVGSERFAVLKALDSWKVIEQLLREKK